MFGTKLLTSETATESPSGVTTAESPARKETMHDQSELWLDLEIRDHFLKFILLRLDI